MSHKSHSGRIHAGLERDGERKQRLHVAAAPTGKHRYSRGALWGVRHRRNAGLQPKGRKGCMARAARHVARRERSAGGSNEGDIWSWTAAAAQHHLVDIGHGITAVRLCPGMPATAGAYTDV